MDAISRVGLYSNMNSNNTGSYVATQVGTGINQPQSGLYPSYNAGQGLNNFNSGFGQSPYGGFGGGFGINPYGGLGGGFNNTGFLIAALLIPAVTSFITAIIGAGKNRNNQEDKQYQQYNSNSRDTNQYNDFEANENFDNGLTIQAHQS